MAQISICDICKQPKETDFKLSLFRQEGKKQKGKVSGDVCAECVELISTAILATPNAPRPLGSSNKQTPRPSPQVLSSTGPVEALQTVSDGVFKVPSAMTPQRARAINKAKAEADGDCKHENKTMEDSGVICRDCRKPIEA
jgi:hypothetical protein